MHEQNYFRYKIPNKKINDTGWVLKAHHNAPILILERIPMKTMGPKGQIYDSQLSP